MSIEAGPRSEDIRAPNIYRKANLLEIIEITRKKMQKKRAPKPTSDIDPNVQQAAVRVIVLQDLCKDFFENGSGEKETKNILRTPHKSDAVILGILSSFRTLIQQNVARSPDAKKLFEDIERFSGYGTAVMYGLIESVPGLYRYQMKEPVSPDKMAAVMRAKPASQIFSEVSSIAGRDAVAIENALGLRHRDVHFHRKGDFSLKSFSSHNLWLEDVDTAPRLVPGTFARERIAALVRHPEEPVYSCLAHYVEVPSTNKTFFQYMHDLMTERYCKHVLGVRAKK